MKSFDSDSDQAIRDLLADLIDNPVRDAINKSLETPLHNLSFKLDAFFVQQDEGGKAIRRFFDALQDEVSGLEGRFGRDELVLLLREIISRQQEIKGKLDGFGSLIVSKIDESREAARLFDDRHESKILVLSKLFFLNFLVVFALACFAAASFFEVF